jgi:hypothetical protein
VAVTGTDVHFTIPVTGITLFSLPSFTVDSALKTSANSAQLIALINRQSLGACNLGCC